MSLSCALERRRTEVAYGAKGRGPGHRTLRINIKHRLVYQVFTQEKVVRVLRMWTHYE